MGSAASFSCDITLNSALRPEEKPLYQDPRTIQRMLKDARTIAMVGLSGNVQRPSHFVATYMQAEGFRVIPVNPREREVLGEPSYPDLAAIPADIEVDIVAIFRRPDECLPIVEEAIARGVKAVWMQLRIINRAAAGRAREAGLTVVMDKCLKIEHGRYSGGLHWMGMNTEIISARRGR
jgi:uncharacterized protein